MTNHQASAEKIIENIEKVIKGKRQSVKYALLCFISEGHLLIEDPPGVGKTMLAKSLARSIEGTFKRIQFTPDLLPSDITGVVVYQSQKEDFRFLPGPIFANVVLADELNRTTPRTQAALLEAMEEAQVTAEGTTYKLPSPFFVIATQNPFEHFGTYPLPEGQLDRFLLSVSLGYPNFQTEEAVVKMQLLSHPIEDLKPVVSAQEISEIQQMVRKVHVEEELIHYAVDITKRSRTHPKVLIGSSPRGSIALIRLAQARAFLSERDYVLPDDIKDVAPYALSHRLVLKAQYREDNLTPREIVQEILEAVKVPVKL